MMELRSTFLAVARTFFAVTVMSLAPPAGADIISGSGYFVDTNSGLDWRNVTLTRGMSYNQVEAELSAGGSLAGWRRATGAEFNQLMNNLGVPYSGGACQPGYCDRYGTNEPASITAAIILLGDTYGAWAAATGNNRVPATGQAGYTVGMLADRNAGYVKTAMVFDGDDMSAYDGYLFPPQEDRVFTYCGATPQACGAIGDIWPTATNAYLGTYLVRDTAWTPNEVCDNGTDDDLDGLVDADDPDCYEPIGLLVRCIHEPLWPEEDQEVLIHADVINANGDSVIADKIEIYTDAKTTPDTVSKVRSTSTSPTIASGRTLKYACRAELGIETAFSGWRESDVGAPEFTDFRAVPVIYNGPLDKKLDIVFLPEFHRHGIGADAQDVFLSDIFRVVREGIYGIPWFVRNQQDINIWLGTALGTVTPKDPEDSSKKCEKDKPDDYNKKYGFADAAGLIHDQACRDNAALELFTTRFVANGTLHRLQVVAHEIGHAGFSLSDEYVGASTLYFTLPDYPNLLATESGCRSAAENRGFNPDSCRSLFASGASGFSLGGNWIFEPNYRNDSEPWNETRDLMQQTGGAGECTLPSVPIVECEARYQVGDSEIFRMNWKMDKCRAGRC